MSNSIVVKGNVTKTEDLRYSPSGTAGLTFGLADNQGYGDKRSVTFWRVTVWGKQAESLAPYILKGDELTMVGEASLRPWTDKSGIEQKSLELRATDIWLGRKKEESPGKQTSSGGQHSQTGSSFDGMDDDLPF